MQFVGLLLFASIEKWPLSQFAGIGNIQIAQMQKNRHFSFPLLCCSHFSYFLFCVRVLVDDKWMFSFEAGTSYHIRNSTIVGDNLFAFWKPIDSIRSYKIVNVLCSATQLTVWVGLVLQFWICIECFVFVACTLSHEIALILVCFSFDFALCLSSPTEFFSKNCSLCQKYQTNLKC